MRTPGPPTQVCEYVRVRDARSGDSRRGRRGFAPAGADTFVFEVGIYGLRYPFCFAALRANVRDEWVALVVERFSPASTSDPLDPSAGPL